MKYNITIKSALISVYDKTGIIEFASELVKKNVKLIATTGTFNLLKNANLPVIKVSDYTGLPEIMNGRIKTLNHKIHGGIIGRRGYDDDIMKIYQMSPIDLVVVNLYPFERLVNNKNYAIDTIFEEIDVGGVTIIRSGAKNCRYVTAVVDSNDYCQIISEMKKNKNLISFDTRFKLAKKAFKYTSSYDQMITNYLGKLPIINESSIEKLPEVVTFSLVKKLDVKYGENNYQKAAFYTRNDNMFSFVKNKQLHVKNLTYNNILDVNTAFECISEFSDPACVIIKHHNPCGVAIGNSLISAYLRAWRTDPASAFGGVVAFNHILNKETAKTVIENQFVEVIAAPSIDDNVFSILEKKKNVRVVTYDWLKCEFNKLDFKSISSGLLIQEKNILKIGIDDLHIVSTRLPSKQEINDALFCWKVVKFVKSNAVIFGKENATISIGTGQSSRVFSTKIAIIKANEANLDIVGSIMASDAFIPFDDSINIAADVGVSCIIQPGGSINDEKIIDTVNKRKISMIFTKFRCFRH